MRSTQIWPNANDWKGKILFIETSEESISYDNFERIIRSMGIQGILQNLNGIIIGRSIDEKNYDNSLLKIINKEFGLTNLPIVSNLDFGHTDPIFTIPIGAKMTINFLNKYILMNHEFYNILSKKNKSFVNNLKNNGFSK